MPKEIIVNADKHQTRIGIVEDRDLVELYYENPEHERTIGNIVLARVRKVMPSIQAAFVDIGQEQDAFLHFSDVSENVPAQLDFLKMNQPEAGKVELTGSGSKARRGKRRRHPKGQKKGAQRGGSSRGGSSGGKGRAGQDAKKRKGRRSAQKRYSKKCSASPEKLLKRGQALIVQITKEPIANKGSRISTDLSLAGRFLVLVPLTEFIAVSKKITSQKERRRLKALAKSLLPNGFGAIIRTVAEGRDAKSLDTDLRLLMERWRQLEKKLASRPRPPVVLHKDVDMVSSIIRDIFSSDFDRILVDNERLHRSIRSYVQAVAPQMADQVKHHAGERPVFEAAGIKLDTERAFEKRVELPSGGYLFIERTEAMHVVDVNSGRSGKGKSQEENSLHVNLEAARVTARQMRLRDLGGICVVDFIDMRSRKNRKKIYDELKNEFKKDRAVTKLLPMSDFGLVQITRQRLRPSITTTFSNGEDDSDASADRREVRRLKEEVQRLKEQERRPTQEIDRLKNKVKRLKEAADDARRKADQAAETARDQTGASPTQDGRRSQPKRAPRRPARGSARTNGAPQMRPEALVEALGNWISDYTSNGHRSAVALRVHPFTAAYLNRPLPTYATRWFMRHLVRVRVEADDDLAPLDFRFVEAATGADITERRAASDDERETAPAAS